jgi:hypothetical protein
LSAFPLGEAPPETVVLFQETEDHQAQHFSGLIGFRGLHFEKESPIQGNSPNATDCPAAEKERLDTLCADADFLDASTRRDQFAVAEKHLRSFMA